MNTLTHSPGMRRLPLIIAAVVLLLVLAYLGYSLAAQAQRPARESHTATPPPDVSIVERLPERYRAQVIAYGAVEPHYALTMTAKVSGYVTSLSPQFEAGGVIAAGDLLAQLEDSDYRSALSIAEETLAAARLAVLEEERQVVQAQTEWRSAGLEGEPDSELVLRQPYLDAALASLNSAEANVNSAATDLAHTRITAPFNAMVIERHVAPGSYVQAGTEIATLYSSDRVEITLALSSQDWAKLPPVNELKGGAWPVRLRDVETGDEWTAHVDRIEQHLDSTTRQRALIVTVDNPLAQSTPLLPGSFVEAKIPGRTVDGLWQLPSSAVSQRGEVWYVTPDNTLDNFVADISFSEGENVYVSAPTALTGTPQRVLLHPLSGYLVGMQVTAVNPAEALASQPTQENSDNG
jgi:membrane fusion protein, multidrug efflux system